MLKDSDTDDLKLRYLWPPVIFLSDSSESKQCRYNCFMVTSRLVLNGVFITRVQHILPGETSLQNGIHFLPTCTFLPFNMNKILNSLVLVKFLLVVGDIQALENKGTQVPLYSAHVGGNMVQVTGDHFGLQSMFALVESFTAGLCCRFCLAEKDENQTEFFKESSKIVLRTKCTHTAHCQEMAANQSLPYVFGVKTASLLNSLT